LIVFHSLSDQAPTACDELKVNICFFNFILICVSVSFLFGWWFRLFSPIATIEVKRKNEFPLFSGRANSARRKDRLRGSHLSDVGRATKGEGRLHNYKLQMELEIRDLLGYHKRAVYALLLLFAFLYAYVPTPALLARSLNDTS
jgi:hypothetical protein